MFWLASYPKSGNTWLRVFFTNLFSGKKEAANINQLLKTYLANDNHLIEYYTPYEPSELTFRELQQVRRELYKELPNYMVENSCVKIHQANRSFWDGEPLVIDQDQKVIYITRNPLDVVISLAHHKNWSIDKAILFMNDKSATLGEQHFANQRLTAAFLSSWDLHYKSWVKSQLKVHIIRYEDMLLDSFNAFKGVVNYLDLSYSDEEINEAISNSTLSILQSQEREKRFKEGSIESQQFFRKGMVGEWKSVLTKEQISLLVEKHRSAMNELSYLP